MSFHWDPLLFGTAVNLRGIVFALLVLNAAALLRANARPVRISRALLIAAAIAASAVAWPSSQLLWCGLPPVLALVLFRIESKKAAQGTPAPLPAGPLQVPVGS